MSISSSTDRKPIQFRVSLDEEEIIQAHADHLGVSRNIAARMIFQYGLKRDAVSLGMELLVERTLAMEELLKTLISAADRKRYEHAQNKTQERLVSLRKSGLI